MISAVTPVADRSPMRRCEVHVTGRRIAATVIDGLLFGGLYGVMAAFFGTVTDRDGFYWTATMPAAANVAYAVFVVAYYLVLESYLGRTVGKMFAGIRVVDELTGGRPAFRAVVIRTALRTVDGLASYLVAFVTVLLTKK